MQSSPSLTIHLQGPEVKLSGVMLTSTVVSQGVVPPTTDHLVFSVRWATGGG